MSSEPIVSFSGAKLANHCLPGDEVEWNGSTCTLLRRVNHPQLVGTLDVKSKYLYGHTSRGNKIYLFQPFDTAYPPMRVGTSDRDTSSNKLVLVQFQDWEAHEAMPRANSVRVFGDCGIRTAELTALQWHYGYPQHNKSYFEIPREEIELHNLDRLELQGLTFNIDPVGCRDIDDILTLRQIGLGLWEIVITIADVAEWIPANSLADSLAEKKGQTLYQNGEAVVPMLPAYLSEDALSFLPGQRRLGISLHCMWNDQFKSLNVMYFDQTTVVNQKSYTYESIYEATEVPINLLQDAASFLLGKKTTDSHEWIEQFMLLYNREVAKTLLTEQTGLLRSHSPANLEKLKRYETIHPELQVFAWEAATYVPTGPDIVHAGLGSVPYAHASSPLRRYADLVNQRALKAILTHRKAPKSTAELAYHLNQQQKKQKHHDRDVFFLEKMLVANMGKRPAIVLEDNESKTKVYVPSWKRIVRVKKQMKVPLLEPGTHVQLEYYGDLQKANWEDRMVFCLRNTNPIS